MTIRAAEMPDSMLSKISAKERKSLGKAGMTAEDCRKAALGKMEKELHREVANFINLKGGKYLKARMDRKSPLPLGFPDFTVFFPGGLTVFWEIKVAGYDLKDKQADWQETLTALGHHHRVICHLQDCRDHLREIDL